MKRRLVCMLAVAVAFTCIAAAPAAEPASSPAAPRASSRPSASSRPATRAAPATRPSSRPAATSQAAATRPAGETEYTAMFLDDVKVGYARHTRTAGASKVTHDVEQSLTIGRGAMNITITVRVSTTETLKGEPLSFRYTMGMGIGGQQGVSGKIENGIIHLVRNSGSGPQTSDVPYPEGALMPEGVHLLQVQKGLAPGTTYSYSEFDPTSAAAIKEDVTVGEPEDVALIGRTEKLVPMATVVTMGETRMDGITYYDRDCNPLKAVLSVMGMKLTQVACDEAYAHSPNGQFDPVKVISPASPVALENARQLTAATYTLSPLTADRQLVVPAVEGQSVRTNADGTLTVEVKVVEPPPTKLQPYAGTDPQVLAAMKPSPYVESDNPEIVAQAKKIIGDKTDALAIAHDIERWTGEHITGKTLGVGYGSAVTTLHNRSGDCTEHAVLTAALCRAAGIPCRIVTGIAYAETFGELQQRFIGHAWDQAYIGGKWVTLDAALGGADAARIVLLAGGEDPASFIGLLQSLGNIRIVAISPGGEAARPAE